MTEKAWKYAERIAVLLGMAVSLHALARIATVETQLSQMTRPPCCPPETPEPPLAADLDDRLFERLRARVDARIDERLGPLQGDDEKVFARLRDKIDRRVEDRLVASLQEAVDHGEGAQSTAIGAALWGVLVAVVGKIVKAILAALVLSVLLALLWQYGWWVVGGYVLSVAFIAWIVVRLSRK